MWLAHISSRSERYEPDRHDAELLECTDSHYLTSVEKCDNGCETKPTEMVGIAIGSGTFVLLLRLLGDQIRLQNDRRKGMDLKSTHTC